MRTRKVNPGIEAAKAARRSATTSLLAMAISITAAVVAIFVSTLVEVTNLHRLLSNFDQQGRDQARVSDPDLHLAGTFCETWFYTLDHSVGRVFVPIHELESCKADSELMFQDVLARVATRAGRFSNYAPFHLWWQGRIIVSQEVPRPKEDTTPFYLEEEELLGLTEIVWGDCSAFPNYPPVSISTVVVYTCQYTGLPRSLRLALYELVGEDWVHIDEVYVNKFDFTPPLSIEQFLQPWGDKVICPIYQETLEMYGDEEETISFLCSSYLR